MFRPFEKRGAFRFERSPIRRFCRSLDLANIDLGLPLQQRFQFIERRVVSKVRTAGFIWRNRFEQVLQR